MDPELLLVTPSLLSDDAIVVSILIEILRKQLRKQRISFEDES